MNNDMINNVKIWLSKGVYPLRIFMVIAVALLLTSCGENPTGCEPIMDPNPGDGVPEGILNINKPPSDYLNMPDTNWCTTPPCPELGIVQWVVMQIDQIMAGASQAVFEALVDPANGFLMVINVALILTIMFFGISVMLGIVDASPYSVGMTALKIILVFNFATNWPLFDSIGRTTFEAIVNGLSAIFGEMFGPIDPATDCAGATCTVQEVQTNIWTRLDQTISMIFSFGFFKLVLALIGTISGLTFYGFALFILMMMYMFALIQGVQVFLVSLLARSLLYATAPIFITFALFSQTRSLFDGWVEQLINFILQPIFLFAFLGMFSQMILEFLEYISTSDAEQVCWGPRFYISTMNLNWFIFVENNTDGARVDVIDFSWFALLTLAILAYLMGTMIDWSTAVAARLSGGLIDASKVSVPVVSQARNIADPRKGGSFTNPATMAMVAGKAPGAAVGVARKGVGLATNAVGVARRLIP